MTTANDKSEGGSGWHPASWEGAEREALRRRAALPLERIVAALEEMQAVNETLRTTLREQSADEGTPD